MTNKARRFCGVLALWLAVPVLASTPPYAQWPRPRTAPAMDMGRRGMNPPSEFGLFYMVSAKRPEWYNIDVSAVPYRQDVALIPATSTPTYPRAGPHMIELYPGGRAAFYSHLEQEIRTLILDGIPADYDGMLVFDYEFFSPNWTGHRNTPSLQGPAAIDENYLDDWRMTLRQTRAAALNVLTPAQQEEYFRQEWLSTTREFFERCYNTAKQIRPNAVVTFYNQPTQEYWRWRDPAQAALMRQGDDEIAWFWQLVDAVCPSVYPFYRSVPDNQLPGPGQDRERDFEAYVRANIVEALRVANGKPVYPYVAFQYHSSNAVYGDHTVNDFNMRRPLEIARELGCNGVTIFGWFQTQDQFDEGSAFYQSSYAPFLRQFSLLPALAPANPFTPPGGGGGGGVAGGTGSGTGTGTGTGTGSTGTGGATGSTGSTTGGGSSGGGSDVGSVSGGGGGGGSSTGSGVVSVGGGAGSGSSGMPSGGGSSGGSDVVSVGGGGSSSGSGTGTSSEGGGSAAAASGGSSGGGSSGGGSADGGSGGGSGGTAIAGGASSGTNAVGLVMTYHNDAGGGGGGVTTSPLAGGSMMMAAGPTPLGEEGGTAVVPGFDFASADTHTAPADPAAMEQALARAAGPVGTGATDSGSNLEGARIVRPGTDESSALFAIAAAPTEPTRFVRPGMDAAMAAQGSSLAAAARNGAAMRFVRPGGASGAGAGSAILSTAQLAQGGRFVRPGQGVDTRVVPIAPAPAAPALPKVEITTVDSPQP